MPGTSTTTSRRRRRREGETIALNLSPVCSNWRCTELVPLALAKKREIKGRKLQPLTHSLSPSLPRSHSVSLSVPLAAKALYRMRALPAAQGEKKQQRSSTSVRSGGVYVIWRGGQRRSHRQRIRDRSRPRSRPVCLHEESSLGAGSTPASRDPSRCHLGTLGIRGIRNANLERAESSGSILSRIIDIMHGG